MKKFFKAAFAAILALTLALSALPPLQAAEAAVEPAWTVPQGYNENDYNKLAAFLELADANGVKNGKKLSASYDPSNPGTWGTCYDPDYYADLPTVQWFELDNEYRAIRILMFDKQLVGALDVSGLSELYYMNCSVNELDSITITGCDKLMTFDCYGNRLTALDVSGNSTLQFLRCDANSLTELDLSANSRLVQLTCSHNQIAELDVSHNTSLEILNCAGNLLSGIDISMLSVLRTLDVSDNAFADELDVSHNSALESLKCSRIGIDGIDVSAIPLLNGIYCVGNPITEFDFSVNEVLMINSLTAEEGGFVGCELNGWYSKVYAQPHNGYAFEGWFNAAGELISARPEYEASELDGTVFIARFISTGTAFPGDADGNGSLNIADAVLALRYAMGLIGEDAIDLLNADINSDGSVNISDAIEILRATMGL